MPQYPNHEYRAEVSRVSQFPLATRTQTDKYNTCALQALRLKARIKRRGRTNTLSSEKFPQTSFSLFL